MRRQAIGFHRYFQYPLKPIRTQPPTLWFGLEKSKVTVRIFIYALHRRQLESQVL
jgi:hypothetical protein